MFGLSRYLAAVILFWFAGVAGAANDDTITPGPRTVTAEKFVKEMQLLARRHPPGSSKLEKEDSLRALRQAIREEFDGVQIEFEVRITSVDWKSGMATLRTSSRIPPFRPSRRMPFIFSVVQPLSIPLRREQVGALNTRKSLRVRGVLIFKESVHGSVARPPRSQMIFNVRSENYPIFIAVGVFITEDYSVSLGDEELFAVQPSAAD